MTGLPSGILCAAVTPFDASGDVDEAALEELLRYYAHSGVSGIFGLGTASESMLMQIDERRRISEIMVDTLDDTPVLLHCGTPDTRSAVTLVEHAASMGIRTVAAIAPYYFSHRSDDLVAHFTTIAKAAPEGELYLYDNPARVGYELGFGTVTRLLTDLPNITGVKDTGDSVGRVMRYLALPSPPAVYTGNNELIYASLTVGARGAVSALAAALPELVAHVYTTWESGDLDEAMRAQLLVVRVMEAFRDMPYLPAIKWLGSERGLPTGHPRAPHTDLDVGAGEELARRLARIEDLSPWMSRV